MTWFRRLINLARPNQLARDIDREMAFHIAERAEELRRAGMPEGDALLEARRRFGNRTLLSERTRDADVVTWLDSVLGDLRYAVRGMRRSPGFVLVAVGSLALGIGATSAMLSVAMGALLGSVPFPDPDRLVHVWERPETPATPQNPAARAPASYPELLDWRDGSRVFVALEGYDETNVTLSNLGEPVRLQGARVTAGFLAMLGVRPVLGRGLARGDDGPGSAPVAVVSHGFWRRRLGGDPAAIGRTLTIDGRAVTVVGVLPRDFLFAPAGDVEVLLPVDAAAARTSGRSSRWMRVVGRLRDGVSVDRASADLAAIMRRLAAQYPETNAGRAAYAVSLREEIVGPVRPLLLALGGAVGLMLLVACTNVASLFLARAIARGREFAVRAAIGAGRGRIVRQLLAESVLVAAVGGAAGAALAWAGVAWLATLPLHVADRMPFLRGLTVDAGVLGATMAVALGTGVAFGMTPALHAGRLSLALLGRRDGVDGRGTPGGGAWRALIAAQIAFTTVLLVGAGLMARSLTALLRVDLGFETGRVVTMRLALAGSRYEPPAAQQRFFETLVARARALPGARAAGAVSNVPLAGGGSTTLHVDGVPEPRAAARPEAMLRGVAGDYFRAMGIRLVEGRALGPRDDSAAVPAIVVSEGLARRLFGPGPAVGRRVRFYASPATAWTVVGVVADVRAASLDAPAPPIIYRSHLQAPENRMTVVVRAAGDPSALLTAMRREMRTLDPLLPVYEVGTMAERVASAPAVYLRRYLLALLGGFALVATLLAAFGLYGVIAYAVARRAREMGIRAALGATPRSIVMLVLRQGATLAAFGFAAGLAASGALGRVLGTLLYGVRATDQLTYGAVAALLAGVTLLASLVPARRAARVDPAEVLRAE